MNREFQSLMLKFARAVLKNRLMGLSENIEKYNLLEFKEKRGLFVTLMKNNKLRGCIGRIEAEESIFNNIKHLSIAAAFNDPRFEPVKSTELDDIKIEISILTVPESIKGDSNFEKISQIRPNVDGVILKAGGREATFQPQVWDNVPLIDDFISELSRKAGLTKDYWRDNQIDLSVYQVIHFSEN